MKKLKLTDGRDYFKPFSYPQLYDAWLNHERMHWIHTEVSLTEDVKDWRTKLSDSDKYFLTQIFRFFVSSDMDVAGGYVNGYLPKFPQPEVRMMLCGFAAREAVHIAAYSHLIETLGMPEAIYKEFQDFSEMRNKHDYFVSCLDLTTEQQIAAFSAFTEGVQLFSSFAMLLNFTRNGTMKGMGQIISWSLADEDLHSSSMSTIFKLYLHENRSVWTPETKKVIYDVAERVVQLEDAFIDLAFKMGEPKGLTADELKSYIRYIADRRLLGLGMKNIFKAKKNPLPWMETLMGVKHTNFFENQSTDYAKGALEGSWDDVWGSVE